MKIASNLWNNKKKIYYIYCRNINIELKQHDFPFEFQLLMLCCSNKNVYFHINLRTKTYMPMQKLLKIVKSVKNHSRRKSIGKWRLNIKTESKNSWLSIWVGKWNGRGMVEYLRVKMDLSRSPSKQRVLTKKVIW